MSEQNEHGLSRYIDPAVKYAVRKRCGFGCVKCGRAIIQYHHFDPPFKDATVHRAEGITLLCGYCHDEEKRGFLSPVDVAAKNANPACLKRGYAKSGPLFECRNAYTRIGGTEFFCQYPILYEQEIILGFDGPEEPGAPFRLQAVIYGPDGSKVFEIVDNEWRVGVGLFDVMTSANRITIKESIGSIVFEAEFTSELGLNITTLNMSFHGCAVRIDGDRLVVSREGIGIHKLNRVTAQIGIGFPAKGGYGLAGIYSGFFTKDVTEFSPTNELEWALARCHDGKGAWEVFSRAFISSEITILTNTTGGLAAVSSENCPLGELAVFTSRPRAERYNRALASVGRPMQFKASDLYKIIPVGRGLCLNPFNAIKLHLSAEQLRKLGDGFGSNGSNPT